MRAYTGGEATILAGRNYAFALRISIKDSGGSYVHYDSVVGEDFQEFVEITQSADQRVAQATIRLHREAGGNSLAPLINADIDAGRDIQISGSRVAIGSAASLKLLFQGVVDSWECGGAPGEPLELVARDELGQLVDRWVEEETDYGATNGRPVESVIQDLLSDWTTGMSLYTPAISGGLVPPYRQQKESVLDAIQTLADTRGWVIESRWDDATSSFRPTFYEPNRTPSATLWTFGPDDYYEVTRLSVSRLNVRNAITIRYTDVSGARDTLTTDVTQPVPAASIAKYGRLWMEIEEGDDSPINSLEEAERMHDAALSDLATPLADQVIRVPLFWPIQLGDPYEYTENDVHYDVAQEFSVTGFTHTFAEGLASTSIAARGAGAVSHTRGWLKRELRPRPREEVIRSVEILRFRVIETTPTTVTYGWDLGTDLHAAWVYSFTEPAPISEDFWPSEEVPRTINAHITDRSGTFTVTNPESGNITYLQVEGRRVDGSFGDMERALIFPTSQPGDYIAFTSCTVNQSDGSVTIAGWTTERANSIAYAYNKGSAGSTSAPTEAMAEAQGSGASGGGLATGFTSDFEITLPASTLAYGEVIKILLIAYINANGTGPDGSATDHAEPVGCQGERLKITDANQVGDSVVVSRALVESARGFGFDAVFSATDWDTVAWTSGTLTLADGTTYSISSGNTGNLSSNAIRWIYFDPSVSTTVLQVTSVVGSSTGERRVMVAVAKRATAGSGSGQVAFFSAPRGALSLNEEHISPYSINTYALQATIIDTVHINTVNLTTLGAQVSGTLHADVVIASDSFTAANAIFDGAAKVYGLSGADEHGSIDATQAIWLNQDGTTPTVKIGTHTFGDDGGHLRAPTASLWIDAKGDINIDTGINGGSGDLYINGEGPVSFGAADSGGSGYKVLRVPN